jgi:hypothetical protein
VYRGFGTKRTAFTGSTLAHFSKIIDEFVKSAGEEAKFGQKRGRSFCSAYYTHNNFIPNPFFNNLIAESKIARALS